MSTHDDSHLQVLLTAYADGSLHDDGCAFIERQLEAHPELRDRLGEIRALQHLLRSNLPAGPTRLDDGHREVVMAAAKKKPKKSTPKTVRPVLVILVAACLVIVASGMFLPAIGMVRESARKGTRPAA